MVKSVDAGNRPRVLNPQDKQVGSSIAVLNYQKKRHVTNFDTSRIPRYQQKCSVNTVKGQRVHQRFTIFIIAYSLKIGNEIVSFFESVLFCYFFCFHSWIRLSC